jgi:hypothetical protein
MYLFFPDNLKIIAQNDIFYTKENTMKKIISVLVLSVMVSGGAFALDLAFGGGLLLDISGNNGVKGKFGSYSMYEGIRNTSFGVYGFFDITYVEFSLYSAFGSLTNVYKSNIPGDSSGYAKWGNATQFGFGVLGKYPIKLGKIILFPALGVDYNLVLSFKDTYGTKATDATEYLSQFGFLGGAGLDIGFGDHIFLRATGLFHLRLPNKLSKELRDALKLGYTSFMDWKTTLGAGVRFNVAIGYKF